MLEEYLYSKLNIIMLIHLHYTIALLYHHLITKEIEISIIHHINLKLIFIKTHD